MGISFISCVNLSHSFTNPLTPTIKKYLDIKNIVAGSQPAFAQLTCVTEVDSKGQLSSSTSALSSSRVALKSCYQQTHTRSASSASSSNDQYGRGKAITTIKPTRSIPPKASDSDMPPPQYVPVRPLQLSNTDMPVSRSTSSVDARKRTTSSSVRSGTDISGAVQSGSHVRPTLASGLHEAMRGPDCSSTLSNSSDQRPASGPRRIPLPHTKPQESDMNRSNRGTGFAVTRPLPSPAPSRVNPAPIKRAPERSKPIPQSRSIASNPADVMPLLPGKPSRSVSQPTLSQLSRAHAIERKLPATTTVKPQWGQSGQCKPKSLMKSTTNQRTAYKTSKAQIEMRPITPCQVPLPPSPSRPGTPRSFTEKSDSTASFSIHRSSPAVLFSAPQDTLETSTKTLSKAEHTEEASVGIATVISSGKNKKSSSSNSVDGDDDCEHAVPLEPSSGDREFEAPLTYETPRQLFSSEDHIDLSATKTPISALLTSIQRGFLLTPSSPLSPPQSYLHRDPISSEGGRDGSAHAPSHSDHPEHTMFPPKKPFLFGVAGEDTGRHALNNVENLNIH
jgi:hypothetical protein